MPRQHGAGYFGLRELLLGIALLQGFLLGYVLARRFLVLKNPRAFRSGVLVPEAASAFVLIDKGAPRDERLARA